MRCDVGRGGVTVRPGDPLEEVALADARMRMFNADGSESEMCGNGLRCVAKFVYDHGIARKPRRPRRRCRRRGLRSG